MANSKYAYTRAFEAPDPLLPHTYIVVRLDGRAFHALSARYRFRKPNDPRALHLMNAAASAVLAALPDICIAYGHSDEFSFVFRRDTVLFGRRASKIVSAVVSAFTAEYVWRWGRWFEGVGEGLVEGGLPGFDGRAVCYPEVGVLRDYLAWRQVDCHVNNLYNTTFWALVERGGRSQRAAELELKETVSSQKNEILFSFGINYNNEPEMYRKGSVVFRDFEREENAADGTEVVAASSQQTEPASQIEKQRKPEKTSKMQVVVKHLDIIKDDFWNDRPWILEELGKKGKGKDKG